MEYLPFIVCGVVLLAGAYLLIRNELVYRYRIRVLDDSRFDLGGRLVRHERLPSYQTMLWQLLRFNWDDYLEHDRPY